MQNRYAGDIGDYVKLALLRSLSIGRKLGVAWYLYPDEGHNGDGRHTSYLEAPHLWRHLDPELFDALRETRASGRSVRTLETILGPSATFASSEVDSGLLPAPDRPSFRDIWFADVRAGLKGCDLVFADPDNGLVDDHDTRRRQKRFGKQMPLREVLDLSQGRAAVVYHHNTRRRGGHDAEVDFWLGLLGDGTLAVRANAYSCRTFFVINADGEIRERTREFCERWRRNSVWLHREERGNR